MNERPILSPLDSLRVSLKRGNFSAVLEQSEKVSKALSCGVNAAKEKTEELKKYTTSAVSK